MPVEIIRRILQKRAEEEAAAKEEARKAAEEERQRKEREERLRKQKEEERRQFVIEQTEKVMSDSTVLDGLKRIEKEMLEGNVEEHALIYNPEDGKAVLVWGKGFTVSNNEINTTGSYDYSTVEVRVNPDNETLRIMGSTQAEFEFNKRQRGNKDKIDEALAEAYLSPARMWPSSSSRDSSWGDNDGCCCCGGG